MIYSKAKLIVFVDCELLLPFASISHVFIANEGKKVILRLLRCSYYPINLLLVTL